MKGPLLVIDAATYRGTVAVIHGSDILAEGETAMRGELEERLMPAVAAALVRSGVSLRELHGVVCGTGPGSFTSLRIAASIGKALALGAGTPLLSVPSLLLLIAGQGAPPPGRYLAALDAMRDQVFIARGFVGPDGKARLESEAELVDGTAADAIAADEARTMVGPRCTLAWSPHARGVARLADPERALGKVDLGSWEPSYGRLAEAQVQWERKHGRSLSA